MKNILSVCALVAVTSFASAAVIELNPLEGSFTTGDLTGFTISGAVSIETNGFGQGLADTSGFSEGDLLIFTFNILDLSNAVVASFVLANDPLAAASFFGSEIVGFDYLGVDDFDNELNAFYDAFAPIESAGIFVTFTDSLNNVSTGTLNLPVNVSEPSALGGIAALGAVLVALRRRAA